MVALGIVFSAAAVVLGGTAAPSADPAASLPRGAESTEVASRLAGLPSSSTLPAVIVFTRDDGATLTRSDQRAIATARSRFEDAPLEGRVGPPIPAEDGQAALVVVPLSADLPNDQLAEVVQDLRQAAGSNLPTGLRAELTGGAGFAVDLAAVFEGANFTLLGATATVVALLLLITYRSPWLWLVPLTVVGVADQVAAKICNWLSRNAGWQLDESTLGITSVLVFGAGTNYALLLIARYREELRRHEDRHAAMRQAIGSAAPAIAGSSSTVVISLLTLTLADSPFVRSIGWAGAVGILVALGYALSVLPAALVLFGRGLFWPFAPRVGQPDPTEHGPWARVGQAVVRRPVPVLVVGLALLATLATGIVGLRSGLSQTEQFRERVEAIAGQETLARHYPAGTSQPTVILTNPRSAEAVTTAAASVPGVASARIGQQDGDLAEVQVVLEPQPGTAASREAIGTLRSAVHPVPEADALVGGAEAEAVDERAATRHDQRLVAPLILAIVLIILLGLLRSVVAAVLLVLTVIASFGAALGAGWFAFDRLFGFGDGPAGAAAGIPLPGRPRGGLQHLLDRPSPRGDPDSGGSRGRGPGPRRHRRRHHQRRGGASRGVRRARSFAVDHPHPDRGDRGLWRLAGHAGRPQPARPGPGQSHRPLVLVAVGAEPWDGRGGAGAGTFRRPGANRPRPRPSTSRPRRPA